MVDYTRPLWAQIKELEEGNAPGQLLGNIIKELLKNWGPESLRSEKPVFDFPELLTGKENPLEMVLTVVMHYQEENALLKKRAGFADEIFKHPDPEAVTAARIAMYGPVTELGKRIEAAAILEQTHGTKEEQITAIARFNDEMIAKLQAKDKLMLDEETTLKHCLKWKEQNK